MSGTPKNTIFNKTLNAHCRKFLVKNPGKKDPSPAEYVLSHTAVQAEYSEHLLRHEGVVFHLYGENIPLVLLLNSFGVKGVEALIEQKAIQFALWTPMVTYMVSDVKGIDPLQSGALNSPSHSDPEESIKSGLQWKRDKLNSSDEATLIKKLRDSYVLPHKNFADKAARFGVEGYKANKFQNLGLPNEKDVRSLTVEERSQLCTLATESMDLAFMAQCGLDSYDSFRLLELTRTEITALQKAKRVQKAEDQIFEIEGIPSIASLVMAKKLDVSQIPKIRSSSHSEKYRKWLYELAGNEDATKIGKEYIDAITSPGFFDSVTGKVVKSLCVSGFSAGVGALVAGPVGATVGFAGSKVTEALVDPAISLFDELFLDGLLRGWSPRHYFEKEVRPAINEGNRGTE